VLRGEPEDEARHRVGARHRPARGGGLAAVVGHRADVLHQERLEGREVAARERRHQGHHGGLRLRGREATSPGTPRAEVLARAVEELAARGVAPPHGARHLGHREVEHLMQDEHRPLQGRQRFEHREEGHGDRLRLGGALVARGGLGRDRLREPLAHVALAPPPRRADLVEAEPRHHRGEVRARRLNVFRVGGAEEGILHDVLGVGGAPQHAVGDAHQPRALAFEHRRVDHARASAARSERGHW